MFRSSELATQMESKTSLTDVTKDESSKDATETQKSTTTTPKATAAEVKEADGYLNSDLFIIL